MLLTLCTCQPDTGDARDVFQSQELIADAVVAGGAAHDQLVSIHCDHAEGEGGGEAEHQGEEGGDVAQSRPVRQDPAIGENLRNCKLDKTCQINTQRKCLRTDVVWKLKSLKMFTDRPSIVRFFLF